MLPGKIISEVTNFYTPPSAPRGYYVEYQICYIYLGLKGDFNVPPNPIKKYNKKLLAGKGEKAFIRKEEIFNS